MKVKCPHCNKALSAQDELAGKRGKCPTCGGVFTVPSLTSGRHRELQRGYEEQLRKSFSLKYVGNAWSYDGVSNSSFATHLDTGDTCLSVLQELRGKMHFGRVCIIAGNPVLIVCDSKPPLCIVTSLKADGIADLIVSVIKANGRQICEHQGAFLLSLP